MNLIRSLRPANYRPKIAESTTRQAQAGALERNVEEAKNTNMRTLGRQALKAGSEAENSNSAANSLRVRSYRKMEAKDAALDPGEDLLNKERKFLDAFQSLDEESADEIGRRWGASSRELLRQGSAPEEFPVLAAHSYNHARRVLSRKLPGASHAQLKAASESDPEVRRALSLADASASYLRASREFPEKVRQQNLPESENRLAQERQKQLAEMAAQNQKTFLMISETFSTIAAERRKTAAQLHSLEATTSQQISDMMMKSYLNRVKAAGKGHQTMVYLLSENWPQA